MGVEVGSILEGKVTGVKKFGAFVSLPGGQTGMVHISEVSNEYIQELSDVLTEGQDVKVKVMNISEDGKIALSMKRTEPRPKPTRADTGRVWQPRPSAPQGNMSFEDMMSQFKSRSEEKMSDLRRVTEGGCKRLFSCAETVEQQANVRNIRLFCDKKIKIHRIFFKKLFKKAIKCLKIKR